VPIVICIQAFCFSFSKIAGNGLLSDRYLLFFLTKKVSKKVKSTLENHLILPFVVIVNFGVSQSAAILSIERGIDAGFAFAITIQKKSLADSYR
jgi:hypothetical protein